MTAHIGLPVAVPVDAVVSEQPTWVRGRSVSGSPMTVWVMGGSS